MSAADLNAEPTGTLGLTAAERALMDGEDIMGPIVTWGPERLFTSLISRREYHFTGQDEQLASGTSSNGKKARTEKLTKILVLRPNKKGVLVPRAIFCQCECPMCALSEGQVATDDQESAKRKPILSGEGSRDVTDVPTSTDVPTRPPMYDAKGAEILGAETLADGMSCPTVASSRASLDVRPVVSTADATLLVPTGSITLVLVPTGYDQPRLSPTEGGAQLVNDTGLSLQDDNLVYSNVLEWRPNPYRELPVEGLPHDQDTGGYRSDGQSPSDARHLWHGKNRLLSIDRGLCIPSYHFSRVNGERTLIPCLLTPNEKGLLRNYLRSDDRFEDDTEVPKWTHEWDDKTDNMFTRDRKRLDQMLHEVETEFPIGTPATRVRMHPDKLARRMNFFAAVVDMLRPYNLPAAFCKNVWEAEKWQEKLHKAHFDYLCKLRRRINDSLHQVGRNKMEASH
jgi:hypothetical protein